MDKPQLTIRSENGSASTYIIASGSNNNVFEITADYVNISGFTIKGANGNCYWGTGVGVQLNKSNNSTISSNSLLSNDCGINLVSSMHNIIIDNNVAKNDWVGIRLYSSRDNIMANNNVIFNY
ncbi:MAG: NosD domain-containing protein, partial [Methanosarcinales archaeon]